jgi:hypothetical protein
MNFQNPRLDTLVNAAARLPEYSGWDPFDIKSNILDVIGSKNQGRSLRLSAALGSLDNYSGWTPEEISSNVNDLVSSIEGPIVELPKYGAFGPENLKSSQQPEPSQISKNVTPPPITSESLKFTTAPAGTVKQPESFMLPPEVYAQKEKEKGAAESPFEAFLQQAETSATYGAGASTAEREAGRREEHPIATTLGDIVGMLIPVGAAGKIASTSVKTIKPLAELIAKYPKAGKMAVEAMRNSSLIAADATIRNRDALVSDDPQTREQAIKNIGAAVAASSAMAAPAVLKSGWWQPFLRGLTGGASMVASQKALGEDIGSQEALTSTLFFTALGGLSGLSELKPTGGKHAERIGRKTEARSGEEKGMEQEAKERLRVRDYEENRLEAGEARPYGVEPEQKPVGTKLLPFHAKEQTVPSVELPKYERRKDFEKRKRIEELSEEEAKNELRYDALTGLKSRRAWEEEEAKPTQATLDIDGLKWVNDNLGYEAGDELLKTVSTALKDAKIDAFRIGGDEIRFQGNDELSIYEQMKNVYNILKDKKIVATLPDGMVVEWKGLGFSYGASTAESLSPEHVASARARSVENLHSDKAIRTEKGLRSERGEEPPGISRIPPAGYKTEGGIAEEQIGGEAASVGKFAPRQLGTGTKTRTPPPTGKAEEAPQPPEGFSVELPEAVEFFNEISGGKYPKIKQKLRAAHGAAAGVAKGTNIELRADLWKDPEQAIKTFQHEIGHVIDYVPEETMKRGNILGHLASLKKYMRRYLAGKPGGPEPYTPKEMARLRRIAQKEAEETYAKTIDEEIVKETPYTPDDIISIWNKVENNVDKNLFDYVAGLSTEQKKSIVKEAMKGIVSEEVPKKAEVIERRTRTEFVKETDPAKIAERYKAAIEREIRKRELLDAVLVKDELVELAKTWKPFEPNSKTPYARYRLKNEELYADAFSALAVEPSLVRKTAPNFWRGFHAYMERKPEVKATWDAIQARYTQGRDEILAKRQERIFKGYEKAEKQITAEKKLQEKERESKNVGIVKSAYHGLVEKYDVIESAVNAAKKAGAIIPDELNPYLKAREKAYIGGRQHVYAQKSIEAEAKAKIKGDVDWNNEDVRKYLGAYLQLRRASGELAEKAGSLGIQGKAAEEQLAFMRRQLGEKKAAKIEEAANAYYDVRKKEIVPYLTEGPFADTFSPELVKKIQGNREYARRQIVKDFEEKYGSNAAGSLLNIKSVKGTLREQQNPFIATISYDLGLIRAKTKSDFVRSTIDFFEANQGKENIIGNIKIEPAEVQNFRGIKRYRHLDGDMKTVYFLKNGELQARNVNKELAEIFENDMGHADGILGALRKIGDVQRNVFVKFSLPFLARNPFRDIAGSIKNIPQYGINPWQVMRYTFKAMPETWEYLRTGKMSEDLENAFKEGAIPVHRLWETEAKIEARDDLDRIVASFEGKPEAHKNWLGRVWKSIDNLAEFIGQFEEKGRKLADYKFLLENTNLTPEARAQIIRASSGTPDVLAGGTYKPITNQLFIFSNANIQGERAAYEAFKTDPKRYLAKFALYDVLPKAMVYGMRIGGALWLADKFGLDEECAKWLDEAYKLIPDEDKAKYHCVPLPMRTESGKQVYLRIPSDYAGQAIGAVLYRAIKAGEPKGISKFVKETASVSPIGMSQMQPTLELATGWTQYLMNGNTVDSWTGRYVVPEEVQGAGWRKELPFMAKWSWDQVGGSIVWRIPDNYDLREKGALEKVLGIPIAGPALGAFIKISDRGVKEEIEKERFKAQGEQKRISITVKEQIIESLKRGNPNREEARRLFDEAKRSGYNQSFGQFWSRYKILALKRLGDQEIKQVMQAQSTREREAAVEVILDKKKLTGSDRSKAKRTMMRNARLFNELFTKE